MVNKQRLKSSVRMQRSLGATSGAVAWSLSDAGTALLCRLALALADPTARLLSKLYIAPSAAVSV